ncbi:MAG: caspase family protein [Candidatus Melainabacteria bacterium]|nr:caspase family protein [Candidatus Melainabacteria bacterium]
MQSLLDIVFARGNLQHVQVMGKMPRRCNRFRYRYHCVPQQTYYCSPQHYSKPAQAVYSTPTPTDTFVAKPKQAVNNLKISAPQDSQQNYYERVITFDVQSGQIPSIVHSGIMKDGTKYTGWNSTFNQCDVSVNNDCMYVTKQTVRDPNTGELKDKYVIGIKKGVKVNFNIAGTKVLYNEPLTNQAPPQIAQDSSKPETDVQKPIVIPKQLPPQPLNKPVAPVKPITEIMPVATPDALPYKASGTEKYSPKHSIFSSINQDTGSPLSYPQIPNSDLKATEYSKSKGGNYEELEYGSAFFKGIAQEITNGKGLISMEEAAIKSYKKLGKIPRYNPQYRLGDKTICDQKSDFEVLFVSGEGNSDIQDKVFSLDGEIMKHAIENNYKERCKNFTTLTEPDLKTLEQALKERAESVKRHGRKLYIIYSGHGNIKGGNDICQPDISDDNKNKEGSKVFKYNLKDDVDESYMKKLLNQHLKDVETTILIDACHGGAAITATDPFFKPELLV